MVLVEEIKKALQQNGLVCYKDHNGTKRFLHGNFIIFCGLDLYLKSITELMFIEDNPLKCLTLAEKHFADLRMERKAKGKNGSRLNSRIASIQRYIDTHQLKTGTLPRY